MPSLDEALTAATQLHEALAAGLDSLDGGQAVVFTKYVKLVLPLDGFVFWVRSDLVSAEALLNASQVGPNPVSSSATISAAGSLHYATDRRQLEDETVSVNRVVFTAKAEVTPFNEISPAVMFMGAIDGIRFAFSQRRSYFKRSDIYHYVGDAVYPAMLSQVIDRIEDLDISSRVVSNSLPAWLALNALFPVFPSFLVPDNMPPPYATAHVVPESQRSLQAAPHYARNSTAMMLVAERVRITLYGVRNDAAMDYIRLVEDYTMTGETIGLMNMPVIRDEKRTQVELAALAMKKTIEFEVNYYQSRINDVMRQTIQKVFAAFTVPSVTN